MMIIDAPYGYTVTGTPKGKREPKDYGLVETMPVEIQEISEDQAPLVVTLSSPDGENSNDKVQVDFRYHDEAMWRQVVATMPGRGDTHLTPAEFAEGLASRQEMIGARIFPQSRFAHSRSVKPEEIVFRTVESSERDEMRSKVASAANDMRIIGGQLYRRSREPVLSIEGHGGLRWSSHLALDPDFDPTSYQARQAYYRLDRTDRIMELAGYLTNDPAELERFRQSLPKVHRPDLLKYNAAEIDFRKAALTHISRDTWKIAMLGLTKRVLVAYVDFRDALAEYVKGEKTLEDVAPAAIELGQAEIDDDFLPQSGQTLAGAARRYMEEQGLAPEPDAQALSF